jgi:hypothetical protein
VREAIEEKAVEQGLSPVEYLYELLGIPPEKRPHVIPARFKTRYWDLVRRAMLLNGPEVYFGHGVYRVYQRWAAQGMHFSTRQRAMGELLEAIRARYSVPPLTITALMLAPLSSGQATLLQNALRSGVPVALVNDILEFEKKHG